MWNRILISILTLMAFCQCARESDNKQISLDDIGISEYPNITELILQKPDTIFEFKKDYPVALRVIDDAIIVTKIHSDSAIIIIDKKSGKPLFNIGLVGIGPKDVLMPRMLNNPIVSNSKELIMTDVNAGKLLRLNITDGNINQTPLPEYMRGMAYINLFSDKMVASKVGNTDNMFMIYDISENSSHDVKFPFELSEDNINMLGAGLQTFMSSNIFANEEKDRIISSMYYFDIYNVFDFNGNLKRCVSLGSESIDINKSIENIFSGQEFWRYSIGFATNEECWLKRIKNRADLNKDETITISQQLIKTDWEGIPSAVYQLPNDLLNFCIDNDCLYGIINQINNDNESYYIIRWNL